MKFSIQKPCQANWHLMTPQDQSKFCTLCDKKVYSIKEYSEQKARMLLQQTEKCKRLTINKQGHIKTKEGFSSILKVDMETLKKGYERQ